MHVASLIAISRDTPLPQCAIIPTLINAGRPKPARLGQLGWHGMRYLTGIYALNVDDPAGTPGDWHAAALDWSNPPMSESGQSPFGDWGIRLQQVASLGEIPVASHVRACLDLVASGAYGVAQGMREYFLADDSLAGTVFEKAALLRGGADWPGIDRFMGREYACRWLDYKEAHGL